MTLLDRVKLLCKERNVSQGKMEKEIGISNGASSKWKVSSPSLEILQKLSTYFDVSVDYLMSGKDEPEKKEITITPKDERDISKKLNRIMDDLANDKDGPLYYNGEEIDEKSLLLLAEAIESAMRQLKIVNKGKYGRPKNEKKKTD